MLSDFERLRTEGEALLIQWKEARKQEGIQLEFKRKDGRDVRMTPDDNANLGKCLSGFSNAQGGLVIWGVKALPEPDDKLDCVRELTPFVNFMAFKAEIDAKIGAYLMPRHEDIETIAFPSALHPGKGYVVIRIGASNLRPHRSEMSGDKRYYRRASSSTPMMEHYEIMDMMRINTVARITPQVSTIHRLEPFIYKAILRVFLKNDSFVSANLPYIAFNAKKLEVSFLRDSFEVRRSADKKFVVLQGNADDTIHPGMDRHVFDIIVQWKAGTESYCHTSDGQFWSFQGDGLKPLIFTGYCGCENSLGEPFEFTWSKNDIEKLFDKVREQGNTAYRSGQWRRL